MQIRSSKALLPVVLLLFAMLVPSAGAAPKKEAEIGRIVFTAIDATNGLDLFTARPDGTILANITNTRAASEWWPQFSPDGTKVAFRAGSAGAPQAWELVVMDASGANRRQVTFDDAADEFPHWSPDSSKLVFSSNRDDADRGCNLDACNWEIYTVAVDGLSPPVRITNSATAELFPDYSPDGSRILFSSDLTGGTTRSLYTVNADGSGGWTQLTPPAMDAAQGDWSPDGTKIAVGTHFECCVLSEIWVMNADGSEPKQLTTEGNNIVATWSPSGASIAFERNERIYRVFLPDGKKKAKAIQVTEHTSFEPSWGP